MALAGSEERAGLRTLGVFDTCFVPDRSRVQNGVVHSVETMSFSSWFSRPLLRIVIALGDRSEPRHELQIGTIQLEREGLRCRPCGYLGPN
jgi:hypothetical protein